MIMALHIILEVEEVQGILLRALLIMYLVIARGLLTFFCDN